MNIGKAKAIFDNINSNQYTIEEKGMAIDTVINMETHNSVTKTQMLYVLRWLWNIVFEKEDQK